jgi:hypothetical protein
MKKGLLLITLAILGNAVFAQTLDDVKKLVLIMKYNDAKTLIDKFLADEKNAAKADGWYYKGVIYNEVSKTTPTCTTCKMDAFEAFKKYQAMDAKNTWMNEEQNVRLFDLYNGFFDLGSKAYNTKDYKNAFENFKNANMVGNYVHSKGFVYNGFKFPALDTSLVLNTALAARLGNDEAAAAEYYEKLVAIEAGGTENMEMYEYLANYYGKTKNMSAFDAIISKAKKIYPTNEFWDEKILELVDSKDKKALFAKYEEILASNKNNYTIAYNYSVEMFNYTFATDPKPADYNEAKAKVKNALAAALKIKNTGDANLLMARALYNDSYDAQEEMNKVKGAKPEDIKKRAEKKAAAYKMADECIMYSEAAAAEYEKAEQPLKGGQKANYKSCFRLLEDIHSFKGNTAKAAEAKKKGDAIL